MCTGILGVDALAAGTVVFGANRDERPARPSEPPRRLRESPRLVGGRDAGAGGSWLVVRPDGPGPTRAPLLAGLFNRRPAPGDPPGRRSRGLLLLDVAAADDPLRFAYDALGSGDYAPCTVLVLSPDGCGLVHGGAPRAPGA